MECRTLKCYDVGELTALSPGLTMPNDSTTQLQRWLDLIRLGDDGSKDALIRHSCERLTKTDPENAQRLPRSSSVGADGRRAAKHHAAPYRSLADVKPDQCPSSLASPPRRFAGRSSTLPGTILDRRGKRPITKPTRPTAKEEIIAQAVDRPVEPRTLEQWTFSTKQVERSARKGT